MEGEDGLTRSASVQAAAANVSVLMSFNGELREPANPATLRTAD